jgi:integrase
VGKLTAKQVEGLTAPGRYTDGDGLMLVVDRQGRRYWQLRYRIDGKRKDLSLGPERMMSLREARETALRARVQIRDGIDPLAQRKVSAIAGMTFAEAARAVHAEQKAGWRNGKHRDQWLATLENHAFPLIGTKPVATLDGSDMKRVLSPIWMSHQETARRVPQRMRAVVAWAKSEKLRTEIIDFDEVRRGLPKQRRRPRHMRSVHFTDAPAFLRDLSFAKAGPVVRSAIEFLMLTASRPANIRFMEWAEVDLEQAVWRIPAQKMKMERDHHVPLPPRAVELLRAMAELRSDASPWVFPGAKSGQAMSENTKCKAIQDMGYGATAHGFRATFKDWSRAAGYPDYLSEFQLAHVDEDKARAAYGRDGHLALRRRMMEAYADALAGRIPMPEHEGEAMAA